jgi:hypothetical protein
MKKRDEPFIHHSSTNTSDMWDRKHGKGEILKRISIESFVAKGCVRSKDVFGVGVDVWRFFDQLVSRAQ